MVRRLPRGAETPLDYFDKAVANYQEAASELTIDMVHLKREERAALHLALAQAQALLGLLAVQLVANTDTSDV